MSLASRLRVLVVCVGLEMGVISGVPMRPDEIQDLMHQMNQPKVSRQLPSEDDEGDQSGKRTMTWITFGALISRRDTS